MTNESKEIKHIEGNSKCPCMGCKEDRKNSKKVEWTGSYKNDDGTTTATFTDGKTYTMRKSFTWDD